MDRGLTFLRTYKIRALHLTGFNELPNSREMGKSAVWTHLFATGLMRVTRLLDNSQHRLYSSIYEYFILHSHRAVNRRTHRVCPNQDRQLRQCHSS